MNISGNFQFFLSSIFSTSMCHILAQDHMDPNVTVSLNILYFKTSGKLSFRATAAVLLRKMKQRTDHI